MAKNFKNNTRFYAEKWNKTFNKYNRKTSFSKSKNTNNLSISLSGKDKMCRLNGEVSGNIMMSTDFGTTETVQKNEETGELTTTIEKLPIYMIIQNAVKEYG